MRSLAGILADNSDNTLVMEEAIKRGDYDTVDLLSCGSGYDVSEEERIAYFKNENFSFFGDGTDMGICPKCGQHFFTHNDDGSCVKD